MTLRKGRHAVVGSRVAGGKGAFLERLVKLESPRHWWRRTLTFLERWPRSFRREPRNSRSPVSVTNRGAAIWPPTVCWSHQRSGTGKAVTSQSEAVSIWNVFATSNVQRTSRYSAC